MFEQPAYAETGSRIQFIQIKRANLEILLMNDRNAHTKIFEDHSRKLLLNENALQSILTLWC